MALAVFILATLLFCISFYLTAVVQNCRIIVQQMHQATSIIRHKTMTDAEKEKAVQSAAIKLLGQSCTLTARIVIVLALTFAPFYLADISGLLMLEKSLAFAARLDVLLMTSVVVALLVAGFKNLKKFHANRQ